MRSSSKKGSLRKKLIRKKRSSTAPKWWSQTQPLAMSEKMISIPTTTADVALLENNAFLPLSDAIPTSTYVYMIPCHPYMHAVLPQCWLGYYWPGGYLKLKSCSHMYCIRGAIKRSIIVQKGLTTADSEVDKGYLYSQNRAKMWPSFRLQFDLRFILE